MADIALVTANTLRVVESIEQMTLPSAEAVVAGAPVRLDTTSGKFTNANGSSAGEARAYGIATRTVVANEPLTAVAVGVVDGLDVSALAFDAALYLSNTDGRIADAAGTVSTIVGRVIPATGANLSASAYDKIVRVKFPL